MFLASRALLFSLHSTTNRHSSPQEKQTEGYLECSGGDGEGRSELDQPASAAPQGAQEPPRSLGQCPQALTWDKEAPLLAL